MRLAFVKKRFSLHGGAEQYLETLLGQLAKEGHDLHVFANRWTDAMGFTFHRVDIVEISSFLSALSFSKNAAKALRRGRFDCIVSFERTEFQDIYRAGDGCHMAWLELRSKVEPSYKRLSFKVNPFHRYTLSLEKHIFENTPLIVVNSKMVKEQIRRYYGTPEGSIAVAYNGVDLNRFSPANRLEWRSEMRRNLGLGEQYKIILFVGSGYRRKGLEALVRAIPDVIRSLQRERLIAIVIGKGDSNSYRQMARSLGVDGKLLFLGPRADVEKFYAAADLFVLPTIYDPFSNACLEAMASGLPVVTTKHNGIAEVIEEGVEGFVTASIVDPYELAAKIVAALLDAPTMGMKARAKAEQFPIDGAASVFIDIIGRVCG